MFEVHFVRGLSLVTMSFFMEYLDSAIGMGYGTALTPILLLMGFHPLDVVACILLSEFTTGLLAGFTHHHFGNVDFKPASTNIVFMIRKIKELGAIAVLKTQIPFHLKIALVLVSCSIIGTAIAVFFGVNLSKFWLNLYIGFMVFVIGVIILLTLNKKFSFSWKKLFILGFVASFNKGISGGGYGPVITGGQILAGVYEKSVIGITSLAEGLTCMVGIIIYILTKGRNINWSIAAYLVIGAILAVPFSAVSVKRISTKRLKLFIGILTIILGLLTLVNMIFFR